MNRGILSGSRINGPLICSFSQSTRDTVDVNVGARSWLKSPSIALNTHSRGRIQKQNPQLWTLILLWCIDYRALRWIHLLEEALGRRYLDRHVVPEGGILAICSEPEVKRTSYVSGVQDPSADLFETYLFACGSNCLQFRRLHPLSKG